MRELDLLQHIYHANQSLPDWITIGPGDDMGAARVGDHDILTTIDQVADGVHVDLAATSIDKVARKAITRNLSDVAAMGALPVGAVVAASLPRDLGQQRAQQLIDAMRCVAQSFDCPLFGGDMLMWDHPLVLTVTVLARMHGAAPLLRRGAIAGDAICVTGQLGGSLQTIDGRTHHLDFEPRLAVGRTLASTDSLRPHCMIDLSDGLAVDLAHLCRAGHVAAVVDADRLPISPAGRIAAQNDGRPAWQHAMGDGEDYELCFTVEAQRAGQFDGQVIEGVEVTVVGQIIEHRDGPIVSVRTADELVHAAGDLGWEHKGR